MTPFFTPAASDQYASAGTVVSHDDRSAVCQPLPQNVSAASLQNVLTDAQREAAIKLAGEAIERHMARYQQSHCFADLGAADRARLSMEALIKGRSAAQIHRMEVERGLCGR
jgi:hypothetical protein